MNIPISNQNIIRRNLKCSYHLGSGHGTQYSTERYNVRDAHLVFYYHEKWNCYVVWNASTLRKLGRNVMKANFYYGSKLETRIKEGIPSDIECFDKIITCKGKHGHYEKVVLVPESKLLEFCSFYENYIYPSSEDIKHRKYIVALPDEKELIELDETKESDNYLCPDCRSLEILDKIFYGISEYKEETCEKEFVIILLKRGLKKRLFDLAG